MWHYEPPLRDIRFVIEELLNLPSEWVALPAYAELDVATARQVIEAAGRFAAAVLAPINASGDLEGCTLHDGKVTTPRGYREAYQAFVAAGWPALACDPAVGGQGLPQALNAVLHEMLNSANHAWNMYPGLLHGAYECLHAHASPELKAQYLGKVVSGEWLSTMCLTEAHAGSDLGLLTTRAEPQADGSYRVHGTKIFISGGEHDLTDNIVHMVLARIVGAPPGTKGISLFLVPKLIPSAAGSTPNSLRCDGIEKKMGIKGSATCVMNFDGATGWLVGEPHRGLAAMFAMMNAARLHVGLQGVGHAESAYQNSLRYSLERTQMRAPQRPAQHSVRAEPVEAGARVAAGTSTGSVRTEFADPIALHPAIRHNLLRQRALLEGGRLLAYEAAHLLDVAEQHPDAAVRAKAHDQASLLTPVIKAFLSDNGFAGAHAAQQVFGGHGYVHDFGAEQCVRDSRIAMIYEGTNEIQAIDLLVRKVLPDGGAKLVALMVDLEAALPANEVGAQAQAWLGNWRQITLRIVSQSGHDAELPYRVAGDFLRLAGLVLLAQGWARAEALAAKSDSAFHVAKRETAHYYLDYVLPEAGLCLARVRAGQNSLPHLLPISA